MVIFDVIFAESKKSILCSGVLLLAAAAPAISQAAGLLDPYASANRNPFVQIYGLSTAHSAELIAAGAFSTDLQLEVSNSFTEHSKAMEQIFIDGESQRVNLQFRMGVLDGVELGLDIPYLQHDGGSLDGFIDGWHKFFGLPDGGRPAYPRDQLRFYYERNGQVLVDLTQSQSGIGDVSVSAGYQLSNAATRQWALRSQLKLPTGDADKLLGSDSTDLAVALHVSDQSLLADYGVVLHGGAGVLWMDKTRLLNDLREDWVLFGSTTLAWQASDNVSLKLQLDAHSAFYDSALRELGSDSAQLIMGGAVRLSDRWVVDLAVSEDIAVSTAPDVVFLIGIKGGEF